MPYLQNCFEFKKKKQIINGLCQILKLNFASV